MSKLSINMRRLIVRWCDILWLIDNHKANRKTRKRCKLNNKCCEEAQHRIQYREFEGNLCIALDNIPLFPVDGFNNECLDATRETFQKYIFDQRGGNK